MNEQALRFSVEKKKTAKRRHTHKTKENHTHAYNLFLVELFGGEQPVKK